MTARRRATAFSLLAVLMLAAAAFATQQDKKKEAQLRTVHGTVMDAHETAVADSVVYLKNTRSQDIKTHIADAGGLYRFSGLDPNVDYEIHAEHGDMTSITHSISSFDSRKDIDIVLKLDKKKPSQ